MDRPFIFFLILAVLSVAVFLTHGIVWDRMQNIRPALVAGRFYTENPAQLRSTIQGLLAAKPQTEIKGDILAIIAPHANYEYSGTIAAKAFSLVKGRTYKRVVVVAPSHVVAFPFVSVFNGDGYQTPLGLIDIDKDFSKRLAQEHPFIKLSDQGHAPYRGVGEHAVEIMLPFLQEALGSFDLVAVVMGEQNYDIERALGLALARLIRQEPDTLIVISTDLSHFHAYDEAVSMDQKVLDSIQKNDFFSLSVNFAAQLWEACGGGPVVSGMIASQELGGTENILLGYANSGDFLQKDKSRVVGYGAAALVRNKERMEKNTPSADLSSDDKTTLLTLARQSVESSVAKKPSPALPQTPALKNAAGAFVTLKKNGALRGCVGYLTPSKNMDETVQEVAALAALQDNRFKPVSVDELKDLTYEISIMSPLRKIRDVNEIRIGTDGLVIRSGRHQGILLPQVATEYGWDRATFLQQISLKAGLPGDAWKSPEADLFAFSALVF